VNCGVRAIERSIDLQETLVKESTRRPQLPGKVGHEVDGFIVDGAVDIDLGGLDVRHEWRLHEHEE
jgi:hypothetical protein